jgi:hypothetical protein
MKISMSEREIAEEYFSRSMADMGGISFMSKHHNSVRGVEKQKGCSFSAGDVDDVSGA